MSKILKVDVCIACYKRDPFLKEAIESCKMQTYPNNVVVYYDDVGIGTGEAFNQAIAMAKADIIVLLCSDDVFTDVHVIEDIVKCFETFPNVGHVSRWYHQFVDGDRHPVRAWRGPNEIELANNPSGLAFRKNALQANSFKTFPGAINYIHRDRRLTNRIFVEAAQMVADVINDSWWYSILKYDTVAVRIHKSISRTPDYYKKMFKDSPVLSWAELGWKSNDFTSLIQIKNNFTTFAVFQEAKNFIRVNPSNIFNPAFWFFALVALVTPRPLLYRIPEIYRSTLGRWFTHEVRRPKDYNSNTRV